MASIFSKIICGELPAHIVAQNERFMAFLDIHPLRKGHTLVIPKIEVDYIFDLDDNVLSEMMVFAKQVSKGIRAVIPCLRVGVAVIGLEIPHTHIHLVPINSVYDMNFTQPTLVCTEEELVETAKAIQAKMK